jgi:transcriptional regulator with XRE-family HTH domain
MVPREDHWQKEKGRALVRGLHLSELQAAGAARSLALHQAEVELDRVARLLPDALQAGISLSEIGRVAGVSRPTLYELRARYGGDVGDMSLAVLQTLANRGGVTSDELAARVGGDDVERNRVLTSYLDTHEVEVYDLDRDGEAIYEITPQGLERLERWTFAEIEEERERDES